VVSSFNGVGPRKTRKRKKAGIKRGRHRDDLSSSSLSKKGGRGSSAKTEITVRPAALSRGRERRENTPSLLRRGKRKRGGDGLQPAPEGLLRSQALQTSKEEKRSQGNQIKNTYYFLCVRGEEEGEVSRIEGGLPPIAANQKKEVAGA